MQKQAPFMLDGVASYFKSALEVCNMFDDLGEQEHVFSLLDEWAGGQYNLDLTYLTGSKSEIVKKITKLMMAVQDKELETIKKNPNLKIGFSYHSKLLARLWGMLIDANKPSKLYANLTDIKLALLQASNISADIKSEQLNLLNEVLKPLASIGQAVKEGGTKGHEETYGSDETKSNKRKEWQKWIDEAITAHPDHSFEAIKKIVVKNHSGKVSIHQLKRYTKDIRKS